MKTITIQKTSKPIKAAFVLFTFGMFLSLLVIAAAPNDEIGAAATLAALGFAALIVVTKIVRWWNHA